MPAPGLGQHGDDEAFSEVNSHRMIGFSVACAALSTELPCASFRILQMLLGSVMQAAASRLGQPEGIAPNSHVHPWQKKELNQR